MKRVVFYFMVVVLIFGFTVSSFAKNTLGELEELNSINGDIVKELLENLNGYLDNKIPQVNLINLVENLERDARDNLISLLSLKLDEVINEEVLPDVILSITYTHAACYLVMEGAEEGRLHRDRPNIFMFSVYTILGRSLEHNMIAILNISKFRHYYD